MTGHDTLPKPARGFPTRVFMSGWLTAMALLACGCEEHRMTLSQFLEVQKDLDQRAAASQPAEPPSLTDEERAMLDRQLGPYRASPGDLLSVTVSGGDNTPGTTAVATPVRVDKNGDIRLPRIGNVKVGGLELDAVEQRILDTFVEKQVYVDRDQIAVSAQLTTAETTPVLVVGAATAPGLVQLRRTERNPLQAIVAAGGVTETASGQVTLKRLRQPGQEMNFDLRDPAQIKASLAAAPLESGDIIEVQAAEPSLLFVGGLVNAPGPQTYTPGTSRTLLQAIAAASGLRTDVTPREATLIRRLNGQDYHVKLDLDRITTAKDPNIMLAAGDVLWVPDTVETRIQDFINRNLILRFGASANYNLDYNMSGEDYLNSASRRRARLNNGTSGLQNQIDPFGFLQRNQTLQSLNQ